MPACCCHASAKFIALHMTKDTINSIKSFFMFRKEKVEILLVDFLSLDQAMGFHKPVVKWNEK
jgi:hypothetical protein